MKSNSCQPQNLTPIINAGMKLQENARNDTLWALQMISNLPGFPSSFQNHTTLLNGDTLSISQVSGAYPEKEKTSTIKSCCYLQNDPSLHLPKG